MNIYTEAFPLCIVRKNALSKFRGLNYIDKYMPYCCRRVAVAVTIAVAKKHLLIRIHCSLITNRGLTVSARNARLPTECLDAPAQHQNVDTNLSCDKGISRPNANP